MDYLQATFAKRSSNSHRGNSWGSKCSVFEVRNIKDDILQALATSGNIYQLRNRAKNAFTKWFKKSTISWLTNSIAEYQLQLLGDKEWWMINLLFETKPKMHLPNGSNRNLQIDHSFRSSCWRT